MDHRPSDEPQDPEPWTDDCSITPCLQKAKWYRIKRREIRRGMFLLTGGFDRSQLVRRSFPMNSRRSSRQVHYIPALSPSSDRKAPYYGIEILRKTRINLRNMERRFAPLNTSRCCEFITLELHIYVANKSATNLERPASLILSSITIAKRG